VAALGRHLSLGSFAALSFGVLSLVDSTKTSAKERSR